MAPSKSPFYTEESGGSERINHSPKVSHRESGQGLGLGLLTPMPAVFPLNPRVSENKGFEASVATPRR